MKIVTNNPKVKSDLTGYEIDFVDGEYLDVLLRVKTDVIDRKMVILSHPLSGSIKPNETYYKSIMVSDGNDGRIDLTSLEYMENAIEVFEKFIKSQKRPNWTQEVLEDFAVVDFFLIKSATESVNRKY